MESIQRSLDGAVKRSPTRLRNGVRWPRRNLDLQRSHDKDYAAKRWLWLHPEILAYWRYSGLHYPWQCRTLKRTQFLYPRVTRWGGERYAGWEKKFRMKRLNRVLKRVYKNKIETLVYRSFPWTGR